MDIYEENNTEIVNRINNCKLSSKQIDQLHNIFMTGKYNNENGCFEKSFELIEIINRKVEVQPEMQLDSIEDNKTVLRLKYFRYQLDNLRNKLLDKISWNTNEIMNLLLWDDQQHRLKENLLICNVGLVKSKSRQTHYYTIEYEDFVSQESMDLIRASNRHFKDVETDYGYIPVIRCSKISVIWAKSTETPLISQLICARQIRTIR